MRFLVLAQYFPPEIGAPQLRLAALVRELRRLGHEVEVVTAMPNHPTGRIFPEYRGRFYRCEEWEGVPVHRVWLYPSLGAGIKRVLNYLSFSSTCLLALARARKPDYVFVESPPLFLGVPGYLASQLWRVPLIFNVADLWPDSVRELGLMRDGPFLRLAEALERWIYHKAAYVNAVTKGIRTVLIVKKQVPEAKVLFLPNGVDTDLFRPRPPDRDLAHKLGLEDRKIVLYAGTLGYAQGLDVALEAMQLLQRDGNVSLVFVGDGSEREKLIKGARTRGIANVIFLDPCPPERVARLYSIAYAGFASLRGLPLFKGARPSKLFPIMASGKPVIYSGAGEGARLIEEARAGLVVPPEDPKALAEAIRHLVEHPELAAEMGRNGRAFVERNLSWSALVEDWLAQLAERERCHGRTG
ncbi:MAG: glycosyltransferase family 4 protein [Candidatus Aminicenantes bacterium]|nr:glycosyltransferase family 4 protein [Candidatus Aminicenantes bacterium]